jgi:hypothetical protein
MKPEVVRIPHSNFEFKRRDINLEVQKLGFTSPDINLNSRITIFKKINTKFNLKINV